MARRSARCPACFLLFSFLAAAQGPPSGDDIVTDRPDITESSIVVPKGSLQFENGFTWASDHGIHILDASETLIRLGVSARTELRVVAPNYLQTFSRSSSGFSDLEMGIKQQLGPLPGDVDLAVIVALSLPTGAPQVSSHGFDPVVKFPWSRKLGRKWSTGGMQSLFWDTQDGKRNLVWEPTFYLEREAGPRAALFGEYGADFPALGRARHTAHFGAAYKLTPKQQIDFHFGFGLSQASPERFFAGGYSFRIDRLWGNGEYHAASP